MSNLIRFEPMREMITLREAMDRLFNDAFTPSSFAGSLQVPAVDLYQTENDVVVKASLPGLKAEDVQITSQKISRRFEEIEHVRLEGEAEAVPVLENS